MNAFHLVDRIASLGMMEYSNWRSISGPGQRGPARLLFIHSPQAIESTSKLTQESVKVHMRLLVSLRTYDRRPGAGQLNRFALDVSTLRRVQSAPAARSGATVR